MEVRGYEIRPGADLSEARLSMASLSGADLTGAVVDGHTVWPDGFDPRVWGMLWIGPGANLQEANLMGEDLRDADLSRANLGGANLEMADLSRANLEGAKANKNTVWPDGFDPVAAGVIFE